MNEEERAAWLARAVDNLIQHKDLRGLPAELDGEDLEGLMRVARTRLEAAETAAHAGVQHEGEVWRRLLERIGEPGSRDTLAAGTGATQRDLQELQDIVLLRRRLAHEAMSFAEAHRETVWASVVDRIEARRGRKRFLPFFRRRDPRAAAAVAPALDGAVVGQTLWRRTGFQEGDSLQVADPRRPVAGPATAWKPVLATAAALALVLAAIGPIPSTGLAGHPAVQALHNLGKGVGIVETATPPAAIGESVTIEGTTVTPEAASSLLGVDVWQLSHIPSGFRPLNSLHYEQGLGAASNGAFVSTFRSNEAMLVILQERAGGGGLGVAVGSSGQATLSDGTAATFVDGMWTPGPDGFTWSEGAASALFFERGGLRTLIQAIGPGLQRADLLELANGLAPAN